jgi:hypothetical protein
MTEVLIIIKYNWISRPSVTTATHMLLYSYHHVVCAVHWNVHPKLSFSAVDVSMQHPIEPAGCGVTDGIA